MALMKHLSLSLLISNLVNKLMSSEETISTHRHLVKEITFFEACERKATIPHTFQMKVILHAMEIWTKKCSLILIDANEAKGLTM